MSMLTNEQIEDLHHTVCPSFFRKQQFADEIDAIRENIKPEERFEILDTCGTKPQDIKDSQAHMRWYENQLEALIAFNYFSKQYNVALLWDMGADPEPQYCLLREDERCDSINSTTNQLR